MANMSIGEKSRSNLSIRLMGEFCILCEDKPLALPKQLKARALLAYLFLSAKSGTEGFSRELLSIKLWPDSSGKQARTNLRHALHHINQQCDSQILSTIDISRSNIRCNHETIPLIDLVQFRKLRDRLRQKMYRAIQSDLKLFKSINSAILLTDLSDELFSSERYQIERELPDIGIKLGKNFFGQSSFEFATAALEHNLKLDELDQNSLFYLQELYKLAGYPTQAKRVSVQLAKSMAELDTTSTSLGVATWDWTVEDDCLNNSFQNDEVSSDGTPRQDNNLGADLSVAIESYSATISRPEYCNSIYDWISSASSASYLYLVEGEPGIGKTTIVREVCQILEEEGHSILFSKSHETGGTTPYLTLKDWLAHPVLDSQFQKLNENSQRSIRLLLPAGLTQEESNNPETLRLPAPGRTTMFRHLSKLFFTSSTPIVLVIDDVQWCDPDTIHFLSYLINLDLGNKLLILATGRSGDWQENSPFHDLFEQLSEKQRARKIEIRPLSRKVAFELLERRFNSTYPSEQFDLLVKRYFKSSFGNPLFLVQLVEHELQNSLNSSPSTKLASKPETVPAGLRKLINQQYTKLQDNGRFIIQTAAYIGREFSIELLSQSSGATLTETSTVLNKLWQNNLIFEASVGVFNFRHDCLRQAVVSTAGPVLSTHCHSSIASAYELLCEPDTASRAGLIAFHWKESGNYRKAARWYLDAGEYSMQIAALFHARDSLSAGIELLDRNNATEQNPSISIKILINLSVVWQGLEGFSSHGFQQCCDRLEEILHLSDPQTRFDGLSRLRVFYADSSRLGKALEISNTMRQIAMDANNTYLKALAFRHVGFTEFLQAEYKKSAQNYLHGITLTDRLLSRHDETPTGSQLSQFFQIYGTGAIIQAITDTSGKTALALLDKSVSLRPSDSDPLSQTFYHFFFLQTFQILGMAERMSPHIDQLFAISTNYDLIQARLFHDTFKGWTETLKEFPARGINRMQQAIDELNSIHHFMFQPVRYDFLTQALIADGNYSVAYNTAQKGLSVSRATQHHYWDSLLTYHSAEADFMLSGSMPTFLKELERACAIANEQGAASLQQKIKKRSRRVFKTVGTQVQIPSLQ